MDVSLFDYELPPEHIAQQPLPNRPDSRMLVMARKEALRLCDGAFADLPDHVRAGDLVVLNDTRVIRARLMGRRPTGGKVEVLLLRQLGQDVWEALARPGARLQPGGRALFGGGELEAEILAVGAAGLRTVRLIHNGPLEPLLDRLGQVPLPPYIKRKQPRAEDAVRYQTVYASRPGAAAAPTAGLHFDAQTLDRLRTAGAAVAYVTLHVGLGTFQPVGVDRVEEHHMHAEWCQVPTATADAIQRARQCAGRVIAVGTTVVRTLESHARPGGIVSTGAGLTDIFIHPGYQFHVVDALLTNFHLPRSTLLMMVSAFAGRQRVLQAYRYAIEAGYRFYSYGDCMLII